MNKPINLKKASALADEIRRLTEEIDFYAGLPDPSRSADRIAELKETVAAVKHDLEPLLAPIDAVIAEAQGKARERTISAISVILALSQVERTLDIPRSRLDGIRVDADLNAQAFPRAYKYPAMSTAFTAKYRNGSWRLTDVERRYCRRSPKIAITHTEQSKEALIDRFSAM